MTAPLSASQNQQQQVPGIAASVRGRIMQRGAYTTMLTSGGAYYNGDGWYWERYPNIISGMQGTTVPSTETGVTLDTPMPQSELKVGGGPSQAEIPDYGGTAAY